MTPGFVWAVLIALCIGAAPAILWRVTSHDTSVSTLSPSVLSVVVLASWLALLMLYLACTDKIVHAFYVLTNHRGIVITPRGRRAFTMDYYDREALRAATTVHRRDGSGDVILRTRTVRSGKARVEVKDGFLDVVDVGGIAALVDSVAERPDPAATLPHQEALQGESAREVPEYLGCALERHLKPGERVLWQHQPSLQTTLGWPAFSIIGGLSTLTLVAACAYWLTKMPQKSDLRMLLICGTVALLGLMCAGLLGWGLWSLCRVRDVLYAVTDRRAVVLMPSGRREWRIAGHQYAAIRSMQVHEDANGSGTIRLDFSSEEAMPLPGEAFVGIPSVRHVAAMIERGRLGVQANGADTVVRHR